MKVSGLGSSLVGGDANRLAKTAQAVLLESFDETADDGLHDARSFINQAGINLNERGAGGDLFPGIRGIEDTADADDSQRAAGLAVKVTNHFRAADAQRTTAQSARFGIEAL